MDDRRQDPVKRDELAGAVQKTAILYDRLYGDGNGHKGDIPEIMKHLEKINGRQGESENQIDILKSNDKVNEERWNLLKWIAGGGLITGGGSAIAWLKSFLGG